MTPLVRHTCTTLLMLLAAWTSATRADAEPLRFRIVEGRVLNAFHQDGDVAAHLLLTSGEQPRILAAFPAGNSGIGVWFRESPEPVRWTLDTVRSERRPDARGRPLRGIRAEASVDGGPLVVRDAVLGSVRVLRDFQLGTAYPPDTRAEAQIDRDTVRWSRDRIDGAPGYEIALEVTHGEVRRDGDAIVLAPVDGEPIRLRITALTGEQALTPFPASQLFAPGAGDDLHSRQALRFLSYHEKFLAGSWRFDTYFGRDTLMSLRLLMPALRPEAVEAGLSSVLERLDPNGEVAHEEDIGEFAVLRHRKEGTPSGAADTPIYDYKMIDDDFMLAPMAAIWLLDHPDGRKRAQAFLARRLGTGETNGAAMVRNFGFVLRQARAFAQDPVARNLVALKAGLNVGQWRDSEDGLAGGRYAYDVNAVFVPAALSAIARFVDAGLLDDRVALEQRAALAEAAAYGRTWMQRAPPLFAVELPAADARERIRRYATLSGVDADPALASLGEGPLRFPALALDGDGKPIPVLHSDTGFALLFTDPDPSALDDMVQPTLRPFPAGLLTGAGMLVANPALASGDVQRVFGPNAYHGTVVWSWQQALMAAGLQRQLERRDLPQATRTRLESAQAALWDAIDATRATRTSELWSWSYADGRYRAEPFGQNRGDADESNAAQLWSTVYLAVHRPRAAALPTEGVTRPAQNSPQRTGSDIAPKRATEAGGGAMALPAFTVPYSIFASPESLERFGEVLDEGRSSPGLSGGIESARAFHDRINSDRADRMRRRYPVELSTATIAGVDVDIVEPAGGVPATNGDRALIVLHGGAFLWGAHSGALVEAIPIAALGRMRVIGVDYRQGPEHVFPAATDDVLAVYRALLKRYPAANIGIYGCSAGGMLTGQVVARLIRDGIALPGAIGTFCGSIAPLGGDSAYVAPLLSGDPIGDDPGSIIKGLPYFKGASADDPLVVPANDPALLARFPPTLLISGTRDFAMSSVLQSHRLLTRAGVQAELHAWDGMWHSFFSDPELPESQEAYAVIAAFFDRHLGRDPGKD